MVVWTNHVDLFCRHVLCQGPENCLSGLVLWIGHLDCFWGPCPVGLVIWTCRVDWSCGGVCGLVKLAGLGGLSSGLVLWAGLVDWSCVLVLWAGPGELWDESCGVFFLTGLRSNPSGWSFRLVLWTGPKDWSCMWSGLADWICGLVLWTMHLANPEFEPLG
jgi:hypothetical protein